MKWFFILLYVLIFNLRTFSQQYDTLNYVLVVKKDTIGNLIAIKKYNPDSSIVYVVNSLAQYKFLFSFEIIFDYYSRFAPDGFVSQTDFVYKFNGKIKEENKLERNNSGYDIYMEGKYIKKVEGLYSQSALTMYFHEPDLDQPILSERFLDKIKIEQVNIHEYRVEFPTEDVNYYHYENGVCVKIVIDLTVANMEIRLVD
jgi:hypothetical protein